MILDAVKLDYQERRKHMHVLEELAALALVIVLGSFAMGLSFFVTAVCAHVFRRIFSV